MPTNNNILKKLSYPYRDYVLALKIMKILDKNIQVSTKTIAHTLGTNASYSHKRVKTTLEHLEEFNFCLRNERNYQRLWSLSFKGKLALFILKKKMSSSFIEKNRDNRIMNMAYVLLQSHKKELVNMLVKSLNDAVEYRNDLEKIAHEWYYKTRRIILNKKIDESRYPLLAEYKSELYFEEIQESLIESRRHRR